MQAIIQPEQPSWWEDKRNTQLLVRLDKVAQGNLSFYTRTRTLLIQGRDAAKIQQRFIEWRGERFERIQKEMEALDAAETEKKEKQKARPRPSAKRHRSNSGFASTHELDEDTSDSSLDDDGNDLICLPRKIESCQYCPRPLSRHTTRDGRRLCSFGGKWKCNGSCEGRWWFAAALKVQNVPQSDKAHAFPEELFPDCLVCKENYSVDLLEYLPPNSGRAEGQVTTRGHQAHLCPVCKRGGRCERA
ncbi:unnamed protein product [Amoebophrya sp. A120]|nr:unnamed protein product [Amoebophrya sp. A120]|eukprot:GSA120T00002445001.1